MVVCAHGPGGTWRLAKHHNAAATSRIFDRTSEHHRTNTTALHLSQWVTQPVSARVRAMREYTPLNIACDDGI
jgi:hypothetical protein